MKIAICGSMSFAKDMLEIKNQLKILGHRPVVQEDIADHVSGRITDKNKWQKITRDPFKTYFNEIKKCDAILVINKDKNNISNYIGANTLIEMAFAHVLDKKIFVLHFVPQLNYSDEIKAMKPQVICGDLKNIK